MRSANYASSYFNAFREKRAYQILNYPELTGKAQKTDLLKIFEERCKERIPNFEETFPISKKMNASYKDVLSFFKSERAKITYSLIVFVLWTYSCGFSIFSHFSIFSRAERSFVAELWWKDYWIFPRYQTTNKTSVPSHHLFLLILSSPL